MRWLDPFFYKICHFENEFKKPKIIKFFLKHMGFMGAFSQVVIIDVHDKKNCLNSAPSDVWLIEMSILTRLGTFYAKLFTFGRLFLYSNYYSNYLTQVL